MNLQPKPDFNMMTTEKQASMENSSSFLAQQPWSVQACLYH